MSSAKFYGLTGGIGSGKSTVAKMFSDLGVPVLDLDKAGHVLLNQTDIKAKLQAAFGKNIFTSNHEVDRGKLADIAFSSKENTQALNQIMHPAIIQYEQDWRSKQTAPWAIIEASVLIESGGVSRMDALLVVMSDKALRWQRVKQRGNQSKQRFKQILQQQSSDKERIKYADYIFDNNGSLAYLEQQAMAFIQNQTL